MAVGTNLSALWILITNGWMQNPVGAEFSYHTMRMEMVDFWAVLFNPDAQTKFVHTVSAGSVYLEAMFCAVGVASWYLLKGRNTEFAKRSFRVASAFGLASMHDVIVLGDGRAMWWAKLNRPNGAMKPCGRPNRRRFNVIAWPNEEKQANDWSVHIPWVMGVVTARWTKKFRASKRLEAKNRERIFSTGMQAVVALEALRKNRQDAAALEVFERHKADLGFGLLLKKYVTDVRQTTPAMIRPQWTARCRVWLRCSGPFA